MLERGTTKQHPHGQLLPSVSKAGLDGGTMLACAQTPENDEAGCAFKGPAPIDSSLDLPWRSLSAKSPLPCLDPFLSAGTVPRPSDRQVLVLEAATKNFCGPSNALTVCISSPCPFKARLHTSKRTPRKTPQLLAPKSENPTGERSKPFVSVRR